MVGGEIKMKIKIKEFGNAEFEFRILETNLCELGVSAVKPDSNAEVQRREEPLGV